MRAIKAPLALLLLVCSCSSTTSARKTLVTVGTFANDARDLLEAFDRDYQDRLIVQYQTGAIDRETGIKQLTTYKENRSKAALAISELQALIAAGKPLVQLVEDGKKSNVEWTQYEHNLLELLDVVRNALMSLGVKVP